MWWKKQGEEWVNAGPLLQWFQPGEQGLKLAEIAGKTITLAQWNGRQFAFAKKCPHAGGVLANGYIDAQGCITCPLHHYKFNMENGRNVTGEGYYLKTYAVKIEAGDWWVALS